MADRRLGTGMVLCACALASHGFASSLILNGKVVMEDGSAPGRRVAVERVCGGDKPEKIADTNLKGEYIWHATANRAMTDFNHLTNGSMGSTVSTSNTPREICTIRASMPGYESTQLEVQDVTALEDPLLPTLTLLRRGSQIDLTTSQISVPHNASAAWNRADREIHRKNWPAAEQQLQAVVAAAPKFARGWEMYGNVLQFDKKPAEAREAYQNAVANDPHRLPPFLMLARLEIDAHDWEATRKTAADLAKADVKKAYPEAYVYQAIAGYHLNDLDNAVASAKEAIQVDKKRDVPLAEYVYGLILRARQDIPGAREHLSRFLELDPHAPEMGSARTFLSELDNPQVGADQSAAVAVALEGVAQSLKLSKPTEAWVPGGVAALSAIAHLGQTPSPQDFFTEFCRAMAGEGAAETTNGIPLYKTTLREYMAILAELSRMGDRHGDSVTIQLSLAAAEQDRTERILQTVGWKVTKSGSNVRVTPGDQPSDSTRLEVLPALGVDAVAMQQALQNGKPFSFEILSERVRLFGGNNWLEILKDPGLPGGIAAAFTMDTRLPQTYAALSVMEPEAAADLAEGVGLRTLVTRYSSTAIHFANAFSVVDRAAAVPGGKEAEGAWQALAGAKPRDPSAFFKGVLIKDEGRLAHFYWLMSKTDAAHQKFFLKDAAKYYAWFRDTEAFHEGVRQTGNPWRANLFHELPLDEAGDVRFPGGRAAWIDASKNGDSLLGASSLEALVPVANIEAKRKSPLDETSAKLLSRHYSEWRALFPIFERLPALSGEDFQALEKLGESAKLMPKLQQNIVMADWHALVELMMLGVDAGERVDPGTFRAICSRLGGADPSTQALALLREMAGEGDLDQVIPARFLHLTGDRLAGFRRVMTFQHVPHIATAKPGPETAAALTGLVYAATLDSNGLLVTEDARFLTKHRFTETGLFAEPALVKSSQAPGSYLTGGLMNFSAFGKNLTSAGRPPAFDAIPQPVIPVGTTAVAGPAPAPVNDADSQPADAIFRADSRLVEVFATVTDSSGHYFDDLTADRFSILDTGARPKIVAFEPRSSEVSVALLLDTTGSMRAALPALKGAALHLIEDLRAEDFVAVYSFNGTVQELQSFTTDKNRAKQAVLSTHPFGETALYDALTRVGHDLEGRPGKKVIVLFTDGDDNSSSLTTDAAVRRAKAAGIPIYTVAQGSALTNSMFVDQLGAVSKATGGQAFVIHDPQEIKGVFEKVSEDLSHGYLLVFQPESTDDPAWRNIEVELQGVKGGKVRARKGYYP